MIVLGRDRVKRQRRVPTAADQVENDSFRSVKMS